MIRNWKSASLKLSSSQRGARMLLASPALKQAHELSSASAFCNSALRERLCCCGLLAIRTCTYPPLYSRVPLWHWRRALASATLFIFLHSHSRIPPQSRVLPAAALTSLNLCEGGSSRLAAEILEQRPRPPLTYTLPPPAIATLKRERKREGKREGKRESTSCLVVLSMLAS